MRIAPDLDVTGLPDWNWWLINSWIVLKAGPKTLKYNIKEDYEMDEKDQVLSNVLKSSVITTCQMDNESNYL